MTTDCIYQDSTIDNAPNHDQDISRMVLRLLDANLNRLKEGIRVVEDIFRYVYDNGDITSELKQMRHKAVLLGNADILLSRDIVYDVGKESIDTEMQRESIDSIVHANFRRICESARVLEECLKLPFCRVYGDSLAFKSLRYQAYDLHLRAFEVMAK